MLGLRRKTAVSIQSRRALWRFVIFGLMGLLSEVFLGAVLKLKAGNWNMHGASSPWMIFDYGLLGLVLMPMARRLKQWRLSLPARAFVYMLGIYAVELVSGWLFDVCGLRIWDYSSLPYNFHGYITLLYAPGWYAVGLAAEHLYRKVDAAAVVLVLGLSAEDIQAMRPAGSG